MPRIQTGMAQGRPKKPTNLKVLTDARFNPHKERPNEPKPP
jgi:hypothetical protein